MKKLDETRISALLIKEKMELVHFSKHKGNH
jgi:hypothetical protein